MHAVVLSVDTQYQHRCADGVDSSFVPVWAAFATMFAELLVMLCAICLRTTVTERQIYLPSQATSRGFEILARECGLSWDSDGRRGRRKRHMFPSCT